MSELKNKLIGHLYDYIESRVKKINNVDDSEFQAMSDLLQRKTDIHAQIADLKEESYQIDEKVDEFCKRFEIYSFHLEHANIFEEYPSFDPASFDRTRKDLQGPENKQL